MVNCSKAYTCHFGYNWYCVFRQKPLGLNSKLLLPIFRESTKLETTAYFRNKRKDIVVKLLILRLCSFIWKGGFPTENPLWESRGFPWEIHILNTG